MYSIILYFVCIYNNECITIVYNVYITIGRIIDKYRKKKKPWIKNDILVICNERRYLKAVKNKNNIELISKYRKVNNQIRKDMKTVKAQCIQMQCKSINEDITYERHNKREYETIKSLTKTPARITSIIEDKNGYIER